MDFDAGAAVSQAAAVGAAMEAAVGDINVDMDLDTGGFVAKAAAAGAAAEAATGNLNVGMDLPVRPLFR